MRRRQERRFLPEPSYSSRMATAVGMLGSLILGAGVWGQWIRDEPTAYGLYLVILGGALLIGSLWWTSRGPAPLRVGDAGVALEHRRDLQRLAWYEIELIAIKGDSLVLQAAGSQAGTGISIALGAHPKGIAKIVQEAAVRIPARLELSPAQQQQLPKLGEQDGEIVTIESLQVTGKKCQHCGQVIAMERDARLCPGCGAIYNSDHVPGECKACGGSLGDRAVTV